MNYNFVGNQYECICSEAWEQAYANTKEFLKECSIDLYVLNSAHYIMRGGYRVVFEIGNPKFHYQPTLWMPVLPLEKVKAATDEKCEDDFSDKLIIDGKELPWSKALITPEMVHSFLSGKIDGLECQVDEFRCEIEELEEARFEFETKYSIESVRDDEDSD